MTDDSLATRIDVINHPRHYASHPSGIECIEISKHLSGCLAQAFQYVWRCGQKDDPVQELKKALWFIDTELSVSFDDCSIVHDSDLINNLLTKVSNYEATTKNLALVSIALANVWYRPHKLRKIELEEAKDFINKMIKEYESSNH